MEAMKAQAAQEQELAALAAENENQLAVDLSELMKQMSGGEHTGGAGSQVGGPQGPGAGYPRWRLPECPAQIKRAERPDRPRLSCRWRGGQFTARPQDTWRRTTTKGLKWMFVDSWWVIGPFPNPPTAEHRSALSA